ncbi:MAG: alanine racemase [Terrimesophilobacter sp.]
MKSPALREATIDLGAISRNVESIRRRSGTPHFLAVVKANAYGHGAVAAARAALEGGADWLGVIDSTEARELREAGISAPILTWLHNPAETFATSAEDSVDVGVSSIGELERAAAAGVGAVHLKVDTGLGRNGATEASWVALVERANALQRTGRLHVRGIFSHLANAGADEDAAQFAAFDRALEAAASVGITPELVHICATKGALAPVYSRYNLVRVGIGCYGLLPCEGETAQQLGLTPAMELSANVVSVKRVPAGSGVSYGHRYRTQHETSLALIPLGYADGIPRQASNLGPVSINERLFKVAGVIAMDQFVVDLGDAKVSVGDRAIIFGDPTRGAPSADDWAAAAGTINYEIVSRLGSRIERRYVGGGA